MGRRHQQPNSLIAMMRIEASTKNDSNMLINN